MRIASFPLAAALSAIVLSGCAVSVNAPPSEKRAVSRTIVVPPTRQFEYDRFHYAPAVRVGDTVILSGVPAWKGATYAERVRNMFETVRMTLAAAGASMEDVVEITTYHAGAKDTAAFRREFDEFLAIHGEYFRRDYPAWTAVGNTSLLADGAPVEMRVMAVIGAGRQREK